MTETVTIDSPRLKTFAPPRYFKLEHDDCPDNPSENGDGQWQLYSFNSRHVRHKSPDKFFPYGEDGKPKPIKGLKAKLKNGLAYLLSYYEHGLCRWSRSGTGPACPWDTAPFAGILIWEEPASNMGAKTYEDRAKDADNFLEQYTEWANGQSYVVVECDADGREIEDGETYSSLYGLDEAVLAATQMFGASAIGVGEYASEIAAAKGRLHEKEYLHVDTV